MNRAMGAVEREAVAEYPELRRLIDLRDGGGWVFFPVNADADLAELRGVRTWPRGYADALLVRDVGDAAALRSEAAGAVVWTCDGSLVDVVNGLMDLPAPTLPVAASCLGPRSATVDAAMIGYRYGLRLDVDEETGDYVDHA